VSIAHPLIVRPDEPLSVVVHFLRDNEAGGFPSAGQ
jgi:hypothetical protein